MPDLEDDLLRGGLDQAGRVVLREEELWGSAKLWWSVSDVL
jgi:hypothetical protein